MLKIIHSISKSLQSIEPDLIKFFYINCPAFLRVCFTFIVSEQCNKMIYKKIEELKNEVYKDVKFRPPAHSALIQIYRLSMLASILGNIKLEKDIQKIFRKLRNEYRESLPSNHYIIKFLDYTHVIWFEKNSIVNPILSSFRLVDLIRRTEGITLRGDLYEIFELRFLDFFIKCIKFRAIVKLFLPITVFICFVLYLLISIGFVITKKFSISHNLKEEV